jgi:hypothetical protein
VWHEVPLTGIPRTDFEQQITDSSLPAENWKAGVSAKTGNPVYERPVVLVIYRRTTNSCSTRSSRSRAARRRLRPRHRLAALSRAAPRSSSRPSA